MTQSLEGLPDPQGRFLVRAVCRFSPGSVWRPARNGRRPTLPVLKMLARAYSTTMNRLVDFDDLKHMPESDRQALLSTETVEEVLTAPSSSVPGTDAGEVASGVAVAMVKAEAVDQALSAA